MEKTLFAQTAEIKGKDAADSFTASFQFTPTEEKLKQTRGSLFFLSQVKAPSLEKALPINRELFEFFRGRFYTGVGSNLKALEEALDHLKEFLKNREMQAEILVATLWGSVLYVAKTGSVGLLLARRGTAKEVDFAKVASGALEDKDTVLLANEAFLDTINLGALGKIAEKGDFAEIAADLQNEYREKEGTALALRLSVQEPIEKTKEVLIADLDEVEEVEEGFKSGFARGLPLHWPPLNLNFYFSRRLKVWLDGTFVKIAPLVKEYSRKVAFLILSPWLPREPGVLGDEEARKRKRIIEIAAVLIVVLLASVFITAFSRGRRVEAERREKVIVSVEQKLSEAESLRNVNPASAANLISEAEKELEKLPAKDQKVASLREKIKTLSAEISRVYQVGLETFVDLSSQKGGIASQRLKLTSGFLFVLDTGTGSVYRVDRKSKEVTVLVSEKKDLQTIADDGDFLYFQTKEGVWRIDIQTKVEKDQVDSSKKWQKLTAADTYRGSLYLLDAGAKQVWKYTSTGGGLVGPQNYLVETPTETPVGFAVDGAIWLVSKNNLDKYFTGKREKFELKNLPSSFGEVADVYTREGLTNLYIFDKGSGGGFVIEKATGNYGAVYKDDKLKGAKSIVVDESGKTVYVLIENTIYSFSFK